MYAANHTPLTPLSFLARAEAAFADRLAVLDGDTQLTYREFGNLVTRTAAALRHYGVDPGDRVAYLAPNRTPLLAAHFAVPLCGAVLVALNTRLASDEIRYQLSHADARVLVLDSRYAEHLEAVLQEPSPVRQVVVVGDIDHADLRVVSYGEFLSGTPETQLPRAVADEMQPLALNYTSGTTGNPKGVVYTHRGAYLNALSEIIHSRHDAASVYLWTLPMFHCNGWCTAWAVTAVGGIHVCLPRADAAEIWRLIDTAGITHLNAAPTVLVSMLNADQAHALVSPVTITTAGAPPSTTTLTQLDQLGFRVVHVYGLTEVYGPYTVSEAPATPPTTPADRGRWLTRQGVGMVHTDGVRVVDDAMDNVPQDGATLGEIIMRGNGVMYGYHNDPEETAKAFRGGWFHTGDLGVWHPDGAIELRDRAKDVIISGGENISTVELENALMAHSAVLEAVVIGVPDDTWGERPAAFIVTKRGHSTTADELKTHCRSHLAGFKTPRDITFVAALPKTSTGKIQKYQLREHAWRNQPHRIQG